MAKGKLKSQDFDLAPADFKDGAPRKFREMMMYIEQRKNRQQVKKQEPAILKPGETLRQVNDRIEKEAQQKINKAAREQTKTSIKRKQKLKERKQKKKAQKEEPDFPVVERIAFHERAEQPPTLKTVPKARPLKKSLAEQRILFKERENMIAHYRNLKKTSTFSLPHSEQPSSLL